AGLRTREADLRSAVSAQSGFYDAGRSRFAGGATGVARVEQRDWPERGAGPIARGRSAGFVGQPATTSNTLPANRDSLARCHRPLESRDAPKLTAPVMPACSTE